MEREHEDAATLLREKRSEPEPPAPAVQPGSRQWASAVGNASVARMAAQNRVAREAAEEEAPEAEAGEGPELAPEEAAGMEALEAMPEESEEALAE
jgi:hypothetical protein